MFHNDYSLNLKSLSLEYFSLRHSLSLIARDTDIFFKNDSNSGFLLTLLDVMIMTLK